ncbi:SDR family oxidoreductase [Lacisediminihabitans sp. H27-G8]|uniref:SDR family oxidoreductase n=1 Tax=Lacisediminihabitans sp. H27-G8 TaxID=3111909 RepID=UPI0038FC9BEB
MVSRLRDAGHVAVAAAKSTGVDSFAGTSLDAALNGAEVLVDVSDWTTVGASAVDFFETSTRHLLLAAAGAGVAHYVVLSVVGTGRGSDAGYSAGKLAQEHMIIGSARRYSIVRATQFFEFIPTIADSLATGQPDTVIAAPPVRFRPIAADDVADVLAHVAEGGPLNGVIDVAGPNEYELPEFLAEALAARGDSRTVVADPEASYFGRQVGRESLVPLAGSDLRVGPTSYERYLDATR